ncbi:MAG TPA: hypothetical protein DEB17_11050 [Chlorobaculum sp.]|uniref:Uncharacterized protein n=1 Tax=Chlorobaculum tepidum (strain ATCC 49652 / DSM 12025 / NBRC 103806 / TLS) TaxID=194439 RepID=Q8KCK8_CHLTE|nr:hypothetical protein CT1407 [Chlorobaculum tepidum TLS]HBU24506.1 hypothetical protein [Chlorobaculum sp.]
MVLFSRVLTLLPLDRYILFCCPGFQAGVRREKVSLKVETL